MSNKYFESKNIKQNKNGQFESANEKSDKYNVKISHFEEIYIRAMRGEDIKNYSDLKLLIGVKIDCIKNLVCFGHFPVIDNSHEIINFVTDQQYITESTKEYDFNDLEFSEQLDCYILDR